MRIISLGYFTPYLRHSLSQDTLSTCQQRCSTARVTRATRPSLSTSQKLHKTFAALSEKCPDRPSPFSHFQLYHSSARRVFLNSHTNSFCIQEFYLHANISASRMLFPGPEEDFFSLFPLIVSCRKCYGARLALSYMIYDNI